jgi:hypothetical protein
LRRDEHGQALLDERLARRWRRGDRGKTRRGSRPWLIGIVPAANAYDDVERRIPRLQEGELAGVVSRSGFGVVRIGPGGDKGRALRVEARKAIDEVSDPVARDARDVEPRHMLDRSGVFGEENRDTGHRTARLGPKRDETTPPKARWLQRIYT